MPDPRTPAVRVERLLRTSPALPSPYQVEGRVVVDPRGRLRNQTVITTAIVAEVAGDGSAFRTAAGCYRVTNPEKLRNLLARNRGFLTPVPEEAKVGGTVRTPWLHVPKEYL